jgi:hypothetical protein
LQKNRITDLIMNVVHRWSDKQFLINSIERLAPVSVGGIGKMSLDAMALGSAWATRQQPNVK